MLKNYFDTLKHSPKSFEFIENQKYEAGFNNYYNDILRKTIEDKEKQRLNNYHEFENAFTSSIPILLIALTVLLIILFTPIGHYYDLFIADFKGLLALYNKWWVNAPKLLKIILPAKIVYWNFLNPLALFLGIALWCGIRCLLPVLKNRNFFKEKFLYELLNYKSKFDYEDQNELGTTMFYNSLVLPAYDEFSNPKYCYKSTYKNTHITVSEIRLELYNQESQTIVEASPLDIPQKIFNKIYRGLVRLKPKVPVFQGLIVKVDLSSLKLDLKHKTIILNNPFKNLKDIIEKQLVKQETPVSILSERTVVYSSEQNLNEKLPLNKIIELIAETSDQIYKFNQITSPHHWDDRLSCFLNKEHNIDLDILIDKTLECAFNKDELFVIIPVNRQLFKINSLFEPTDNHHDIHIVLITLYLINNIIDQLINFKEKSFD